MLTSFPGSVEAAAPFVGAAHPPKAARQTDAGADFADLMRDAETPGQEPATADANGDGAASSTPARVAETTTTDAKASATDAASDVTGDEAAKTVRQTPNLAGFFRSLRGQDAPGSRPKAPLTPVDAEPAPATEAVDVASTSDDAPAPMVIADIAVGFIARPVTIETAGQSVTPDTGADGGNSAGKSDAQVAEMATVAIVTTTTVAPSIASAPTPTSTSTSTSTGTSTPTPSSSSPMFEVPAVPAALAAAELAPDLPAHDDATSARPALAVDELGTASARVPDEPYVLAATSPVAQATAAALRQVTAQPTAEPASVPVIPTASTTPPVTPESSATPTSAPVPSSAPDVSAERAATTPTSRPFVMAPQAARAYAGVSPSVAESVAKVKLATTAATMPTAPRVDRPAMAAHVLSSVFMPHLASSTPAVTAATVTSQAALTTAVETQMADQIVQSLRMQFDQGGGEATIELNPQYLGRVQVNVRVEQGTVSASVQAETPLVREWITSNRDELTRTLTQQGLKLEKLEVAEAPKEQQTRDHNRDSRQPQREPARPRRDEHAPGVDTFDIQDSQEIA